VDSGEVIVKFVGGKFKPGGELMRPRFPNDNMRVIWIRGLKLVSMYDRIFGCKQRLRDRCRKDVS